MKVIACAYACNPFHGSEDGVGWNWVNLIARNREVWVLTAAHNRHDLEQALVRNPDKADRLHFVYVKERPWHYRPSPMWEIVESSIVKPIMHWAYRSWLRDAYAEALERHRAVGFDVVHQLTFVGFRFPGHLWKLGIPFVWGPVGGLENTPWRLLPSMGIRGAAYYAARNIVNSGHKRFLRAPRKAFARADGGVIAATSGIRDEIMKWYGVSSEVICEVGAPAQSVTTHSRRLPGEPLRLAWSGRLLPGKAFQLLLRALYSLGTRVDWRLDIYGDGPCRERWEGIAGQLGLSSRCTWHGHVSRDEAVRGLQRAHLFVITSLKDLTSTVTLEALSQGVPVLCPDHCGFSDVITDECGVKLSIESARHFQDALARTIRHLASDEMRRCQFAQGALRRAPDFSWEAKAAAIDRIYRRVTGARMDIAAKATCNHAAARF